MKGAEVERNMDQGNGSLPNSVESERAILGGILQEVSLMGSAIEHLKPEHFYLQSHRRIFEAMTALFQRGVEPSPVLIWEELNRDGNVTAVTVSFVTNLTYGLPYSRSLSPYVENVRESAARRQTMRVAAAAVEKARDTSTPLTHTLDWVRHKLVGLGVVDNQADLVQRWDEVSSLTLPMGEQIIHELERGELGLLASVTNVGKSTWLRNLALCLAAGRPFLPVAPGRKPRRVLLVDFETRLPRLQRDIKRMLQTMSPDEQVLVNQNFALVCDAMVGDEPLCLSRASHLAKIAAGVQAFRADLVIVDTMAAGFAVSDENSNAEVSARVLKPMARMARETNATVFLAHHIGKGRSENGKTVEQAYRSRGASVLGTFPLLSINLVQDPSHSDRVNLSLAKCKGEWFDDVNIQLDREARWFVLATSQPVTTPRSYDLVLELFADGQQRRTREAVAALVGTVAIRSVKRWLSEAVRLGQLVMPARGIYQAAEFVPVVPSLIDSAQMAQTEDEPESNVRAQKAAGN